jgi:hypothetical protein
MGAGNVSIIINPNFNIYVNAYDHGRTKLEVEAKNRIYMLVVDSDTFNVAALLDY